MYQRKSLGYLCELFGKSRQAYYDDKKRKSGQQMVQVLVLKMVLEFRKDHKRMGSTKLHRKLASKFAEHQIKMGRDKLHALLYEHGLTVRVRKYKPRTTDSNHHYRKYPNIVRDLKLNSPNQLWVSDITYIATGLGFVYLSLITDCYSHKIVGWCLCPNLSSKGALNALEMALATSGDTKGLIHHSDRGIQYCCNDYVNALKKANVAISMTENGDPYENALAERVNGILKTEYELKAVFKDYYQALEKVKKAVNLYNNERPHMSCDYLTPNEAHKCTGELKRHWKAKENSTVGTGQV